MHWFLGLDYHHWLLAGLLLLALELVLRRSLLLCAGLASFLTGLLVLLLPLLGGHLFWLTQVALFAGLFLLLMMFDWGDALFAPSGPLLARSSPQPGQELLLEQAIEDGRGEVLFRRRRWAVTGPDLPAGSRVRVLAKNGLTLQVEPVE